MGGSRKLGGPVARLEPRRMSSDRLESDFADSKYGAVSNITGDTDWQVPHRKTCTGSDHKTNQPAMSRPGAMLDPCLSVRRRYSPVNRPPPRRLSRAVSRTAGNDMVQGAH